MVGGRCRRHCIRIKCAKAHYLQEKENEALTVRKTQNELRLVRTPLHFDFLFKVLAKIHRDLLSRSHNAPDLIIRLSDLLRHLLYNSSKKEITLRDELEAVQNFLLITGYPDNKYEATIRASDTDINVPPNLLFHFFERLFLSEKEFHPIRIKEAIISAAGHRLQIFVTASGFGATMQFWESFAIEERAELNILFKEYVSKIKFSDSSFNWEVALPTLDGQKSFAQS